MVILCLGAIQVNSVSSARTSPAAKLFYLKTISTLKTIYMKNLFIPIKSIDSAMTRDQKSSKSLFTFRRFSLGIVMCVSLIAVITACKMNKTQKGALIGTAGGGAMGAIIGKATGNTAMGAIIGAAVGGTAGAVIGNQMDKQAKEIENSVPGVTVERVGEGIVVEFSSNVLFGFDQSELSGDAKTNLSNLVKVLNSYPDTDIEIQGHTDSDGTPEYNQQLSERRAIAVSNDLITKGIDAKRILIIGYGESAPKYDNETTINKSKNRRVEFLITANEKMKAEAKEAANSK